MESRVELSIVIPAHNAAATLDETLASICCSAAHEIIVVANACTDNSASIARQHRTRVIETPTASVGLARNAGMALATGRHIAFLDADDLALPARFDRQLAFLADHPDIDFISAEVEWFGDPATEGYCPRFMGEHEAIQAAMLFRCEMAQTAMMLRRDRFVACGIKFSAMRLAEDWLFAWRALESGLRAANLPEVLVRYRRANEQATSKLGQRTEDGLHTLGSQFRRQLFRECGIELSDDEMQTAIAVAPFGSWPLAERPWLKENAHQFPGRLSALFQHVRLKNKVLSTDGIDQVEQWLVQAMIDSGLLPPLAE
ncbi:MAG TPA: glycosyltransferase family A protein [Azonexus sp.]|nr:glycosyltransferase family A protein [Azonexus sp.]